MTKYEVGDIFVCKYAVGYLTQVKIIKNVKYNKIRQFTIKWYYFIYCKPINEINHFSLDFLKNMINTKVWKHIKPKRLTKRSKVIK